MFVVTATGPTADTVTADNAVHISNPATVTAPSSPVFQPRPLGGDIPAPVVNVTPPTPHQSLETIATGRQTHSRSKSATPIPDQLTVPNLDERPALRRSPRSRSPSPQVNGPHSSGKGRSKSPSGSSRRNSPQPQ